MQRSQLILGGLVIEPVVDRPRPLMKRILGAPATWADIPDFTIEPRGLAGASNIILACRQIEQLIVLVDLLKFILGRLPMTDLSLHRSMAGRSFGVDLRSRSIHNGH